MKKQLFEETKRLRAVHIINKDICEELDNLVREDNSAKIYLNKRNSDFSVHMLKAIDQLQT